MRPTRTLTALAALAGLGLAACASEDPWLRPRTDEPVAAAPHAAPAPERTVEPAAPAVPLPAAARTTRSDATTEGLRERERVLTDEYYAWREARQCNVALASALSTFEKSPADQGRARVVAALTRYQSDAALRRFGGVAMNVRAAGGSVPSDLAQRLRIEERYLQERADALLEARKANVALVTALQQIERDGGSAKSRSAASKARSTYDSTESALARLE